LAQLALDSQNILHMVAQFVREYVGLREFPGHPETALQFVKETQIDVNPLVVGTIKRARRGFCPTASRLDGIPEEYQLRVVNTVFPLVAAEAPSRFSAYQALSPFARNDGSTRWLHAGVQKTWMLARPEMSPSVKARDSNERGVSSRRENFSQLQSSGFL
jgi:hypothetical protein